MSGEDIFKLLDKMATRGDSPRKRERTLRKIALKEGLSSDALRAKARRWAKRTGASYPLMRAPATRNREAERQERRESRRTWKESRIAQGQALLASGADWAQLARIFGIGTPEGAAQWWRRNAEGKRSPRRKRRRGRK
jgi:transposase-like protein